MSIDDRLEALGLALPPPPPIGGEYVPSVRVGSLLFFSGAGPYRDDEYVYRGKVDSEIGVEIAREAARLTTLNALANARAALGTLDRVEQVVKVFGMVNSDPTFDKQPSVIDAASQLLVEIFGAKGRHARSAVGFSALPFQICVEIEMILEVS